MDKKSPLAKLDSPLVAQFLFHPRPQHPAPVPEGAVDFTLPANDGVRLGARFFLAGKDSPNILFFHGNGEIAADYDDVAPMYNSMGISFLAADYRGYGKSGGDPSVSTMLTDAHTIFEHVWSWLKREGRSGGLWVMGRSLGSAPALEIAASHQEDIQGLVIESGFARVAPLLRRIGVNTADLGIAEDQDGVSNLAKISVCKKPCLVIHAQNDQIIPVSHGRDLYSACPAAKKSLLVVPGAGHNDILFRAGEAYFEAIRALVLDS